jgi:hypothetical protein
MEAITGKVIDFHKIYVKEPIRVNELFSLNCGKEYNIIEVNKDETFGYNFYSGLGLIGYCSKNKFKSEFKGKYQYIN